MCFIVSLNTYEAAETEILLSVPVLISSLSVDKATLMSAITSVSFNFLIIEHI